MTKSHRKDAELRNDPNVIERYGTLLKESLHPIYEDEHGVIRWQPSKAVRWAADRINLNEMYVAYMTGAFTKDEYKEFYRDMGYSLSGFGEVFEDA
jgi:hypothetical protein